MVRAELVDRIFSAIDGTMLARGFGSPEPEVAAAIKFAIGGAILWHKRPSDGIGDDDVLPRHQRQTEARGHAEPPVGEADAAPAPEGAVGNQSPRGEAPDFDEARYHCAQAQTYIAQYEATPAQLTSARWHLAKLAAALAEPERKSGAAKALTHAYVPDPEYPWFCGECGYPERERLQHSPTERGAPPTSALEAPQEDGRPDEVFFPVKVTIGNFVYLIQNSATSGECLVVMDPDRARAVAAEIAAALGAPAASCDTHPKGGDEGNTSAPFMSGAVPPEEAGDAQNPTGSTS
jgi:hypothetical protein